MAYLGPVRQMELYRADLNPVVGSEQGGAGRPVLVVSNDGFNNKFRIVTILPLTKEGEKQRRIYPFEVQIPAGTAGNPLDSIIMPQQIRTIAKERLLERMGMLADAFLRRDIEDRIMDHLSIELEEDQDNR